MRKSLIMKKDDEIVDKYFAEKYKNAKSAKLVPENYEDEYYTWNNNGNIQVEKKTLKRGMENGTKSE